MTINAIIVPLISGELCHLKTWMRYCPASGESGKKVYLAIDQTWSEKDKEDLLQTYARCALRAEGWTLTFLECEMTADESFYHKNPKVSIDLGKYPYGQKSGPNIQFFRSIRLLKECRKTLDSVLLMEVDAFPVKQGWLRSLNRVLSTVSDDVLIAGPRYSGISYLDEKIKGHFNGNSVYRIGHEDFYKFLDCWDSLLVKSMSIAPYMAYDVVIIWYMNWKMTNKRVMDLTSMESDFVSECFLNRAYDLSDVLINLGGHEENKMDFRLDIASFNREFPEALVVHGKCFNDNIHAMRAARTCNARRHPVNVLADTLLSGDNESAILIGFRDLKLARIISMQLNKLSPRQISLIKKNIPHE